MDSYIRIVALTVVALLLAADVCRADVASKVVQETAEFLLRSGGQKIAGETAETLTRKMTTLAARHGDDVVVKAFSRVGPRAATVVREAGEHSGVALRLLGKHGDDALRVAARPKALGLVARLGDDVAAPLIRHGKVGEELIERFGTDGAQALGKLSEQNVRRLAMLVQDHGDKVTPALVEMFARHGHADTLAEYVWRNKGALFVGGTLAAFVAQPEPFLNAAETVTTKAVDAAGTVAGKTLESAIQPITTEAASQFPWGPAILIGLFLGGAIVIERIGLSKVIKSGVAIAAAKLKDLRMKPLPRVTPKGKEEN